MTRDVIDLGQVVEDLLELAAAGPGGLVSRPMLGRGGPLRQTLIALVNGAGLAEHENPGCATLQVLHGEVQLRSQDETWDLPAGSHTRIPHALHSVTAQSDAVILLTTALSPSRMRD